MNLSTAFPSLASYFASSRIVGLYFASSWCPDCRPTTPMIKSVYESQNPTTPDDKKFEVVYVSSDTNEEEMMNYMSKSHGSWGFVPFHNEERNNLKRKFGVCAGKELFELGLSSVERKFGIPTLILIDCKTEEVLTFNGLDDVADGTLLKKYNL